MDLEGIDEGAAPLRSEAEAPVPEPPAVEEEPEDAAGGTEDAGGEGAGAGAEADEFLCCVCMDTEADDDNPIIMCDGGCGKGAWRARGGRVARAGAARGPAAGALVSLARRLAVYPLYPPLSSPRTPSQAST
jgi:hypothetical protein